MIALNRDNPAAVDEALAARKPALEQAVGSPAGWMTGLDPGFRVCRRSTRGTCCGQCSGWCPVRGVASIGLGIGLIALDQHLLAAHGVFLYPGPPSGARSLLSSIVTAMISFTGLVLDHHRRVATHQRSGLSPGAADVPARPDTTQGTAPPGSRGRP